MQDRQRRRQGDQDDGDSRRAGDRRRRGDGHRARDGAQQGDRHAAVRRRVPEDLRPDGGDAADRGQSVLGDRADEARVFRGRAGRRVGRAAARRGCGAKPTAIHDEDVASCRAIGAHGAALVPAEARILTHCNAGALATAGYGTALGVIRGAVEAGKQRARAGRRDAAVPAGRAADRLGADQGRHRHDRDHRQHGRRAHARRARSIWSSSAPIASPPTATPPTRSAPTPSRCWPRSTAFRSTSRRRGRRSISRRRTAIAIPIEERTRSEVTHVGSNQLAPDGAQRPQPGVRRHAAPVHHRDHHRARRLRRARSTRR